MNFKSLEDFIVYKLHKQIKRDGRHTIYLFLDKEGYPFHDYRLNVKVIWDSSCIWWNSTIIPLKYDYVQPPPEKTLVSMTYTTSTIDGAQPHFEADQFQRIAERMVRCMDKEVYTRFLETLVEDPVRLT